MQRRFTITTPGPTVVTDANGRAEILFTVANVSGLPSSVLGKVVPLDATPAESFALSGEQEREFPSGAIQQFIVSANVPPAEQMARYSFRLDLLAASRTGEDRVESPTVAVDVPARVGKTKGSRLWIAVAAIALLAVAGVASYLLVRKPQRVPDPVVVTSPAPAPAPAPTQASLITVPYVLTTAVAKAEWDLAAAGLTSTRRDVEDRNTPPGTVRMQTPKPGAKVKKGTTVVLEVAVAVTLVPVPNVVGSQSLAAKDAIERAGLVAHMVEMPQGMRDHRPRGEVTEQIPLAGVPVEKGTQVAVYVRGFF